MGAQGGDLNDIFKASDSFESVYIGLFCNSGEVSVLQPTDQQLGQKGLNKGKFSSFFKFLPFKKC